MSGKIVHENLFEYALIAPLLKHNSDSIKIVSGYASPAMAAKHLLEVKSLSKKLNIDLIYGMAGAEGVSKINHLGFISLKEHKEFSYDGSFSCLYVKKPLSVHSKVYIWCKEEKPILAFVGSANYSQNGFSVPQRKETLAECDPVSALEFFDLIKAETIPCDKANVRRDFSLKQKQTIPQVVSEGIQIETDKNSPFYNHEKITLSLLTSRGDTGNGSRLNWGVRPDGLPRESTNSTGSLSRRNPNQAYIGLPAVYQSSGFFPGISQRFTVLTDDNKIFTCVRAQANGKGIETPQDNSELGCYFRERLGLPSGAYISVSDLKRYGRTDVTFYKLDDENYIMDFASPKKTDL